MKWAMFMAAYCKGGSACLAVNRSTPEIPWSFSQAEVEFLTETLEELSKKGKFWDWWILKHSRFLVFQQVEKVLQRVMCCAIVGLAEAFSTFPDLPVFPSTGFITTPSALFVPSPDAWIHICRVPALGAVLCPVL